MGLIEIVSDPVIHDAHEACLYVRKIQELLQDAGVVEGGLEEGTMRMDCNVNWIDPVSRTAHTPRVELKNINGVGVIAAAIECELQRQRSQPDKQQSTRFFDPLKQQTVLLRVKESAAQYQFLPEFDLPSIDLPQELVASIKESLPPSREQKIQALLVKYPSLSEDRLHILWTMQKELRVLFEATAGLLSSPDSVPLLLN